MDNIYNIFQREKERLRGKGVSLLYSRKRKSIQYRSGNDLLTVVFKPEQAKEFFYFRRDGESGLGTLIYETKKNGQFGLAGENIFEVPQLFIDIAQAYQYERNEIGVEKKFERNDLK